MCILARPASGRTPRWLPLLESADHTWHGHGTQHSVSTSSGKNKSKSKGAGARARRQEQQEKGKEKKGGEIEQLTGLTAAVVGMGTESVFPSKVTCDTTTSSTSAEMAANAGIRFDCCCELQEKEE